MSDRAPLVIVAGFGSVDRQDDGVGPRVAARVAEASAVRDVGPLSDPLDLLGLWNDADLVVVVDAVRSQSPPGTVRVIEMDVTGARRDDDATRDEAAAGLTSTHGIGLAGALRLARALEQAPRRVVVVAIEGERFGYGEGLSPAVEAAMLEALGRVLECVGGVSSCA